MIKLEITFKSAEPGNKFVLLDLQTGINYWGCFSNRDICYGRLVICRDFEQTVHIKKIINR